MIHYILYSICIVNTCCQHRTRVGALSTNWWMVMVRILGGSIRFSVTYIWGNIIWLVVYLPLWKIWLRQMGWWNSQYIEKKQTNHQPARFFLYIFLFLSVISYILSLVHWLSHSCTGSLMWFHWHLKNMFICWCTTRVRSWVCPCLSVVIFCGPLLNGVWRRNQVGSRFLAVQEWGESKFNHK